MPWQDKITEYLKQQGFGIYLVEIKDPFYFDLEKDTIRVKTDNPKSRNQLTERTIAGTHRRTRDYESKSLSLEIFRDFNVVIPFQAIKDIEKIRDSQYSLPAGLEESLRKVAEDIVNGRKKS